MAETRCKKLRSGKRPEEIRRTVYQNPREPEKIIGQVARGTVNRAVVCPVTACGQALSKEHAFRTHIPGICDEVVLPTDEVTRQRNSLLVLCSSLILGTVNDLDGLAGYLGSMKNIAPREVTVSKLQSQAIRALCELRELPQPDNFTLAHVNCPAVVLHWRMMLLLVACLNPKDLREVTTRYPVGPVAGLARVEEPCPSAFDSHFHLDRTRTKLHLPGASLGTVCDAVEAESCHRVKVGGGVAVYCDPPTYPSRAEVQQLADVGVGVAIGMHPRYAKQYTEADFAAFGKCLTYPGVVALGEVGIDYSANNWSDQHIVLDRALESLKSHHVLVLHSRGASDSQRDGCMMQLLYQLKGVVPSEQRIHLHCFQGTQPVVDRWLKEFPNTHFGFTPLVESFDKQCGDALRQLPEDRLLLETDAPYFTLGRWSSTPALIGMVGALVAKLRGQTWKKVLATSSANARRLYGISANQ